MRYSYAPGSYAADARAMAAQDGTEAAPPSTHTVLRRAQPYDLATPGTPAGILAVAKAAADTEGGAWSVDARFALAVDADGAPVASLALRLRQARPCKSAHSCRRCGRWLEGEWSSADAAGRAELQRQMDAGRCDPCTAREAAADPERRAWVVYVRTVADDGASKWAPHGAAILDAGADKPLRMLGVNELIATLRGRVYVPPPPRPGPPRMRCFHCDKVTPFSTTTWRPYSRHRCATQQEGRS